MSRSVKNKGKSLAIIALITASIASGVGTPIANYGLKFLPTELFGLLRHAIPFVILGVYLLFSNRKRLDRKDMKTAILFGFLLYCVSNGLFFMGVQRSGSVNAAIIWLLEPLLMFIVSVEVMKERFSAKIFAGIAMAFAGSMLVVFGPMLLQGQLAFAGSLIGNLLLVGCVLASISGTWVAKLGLKKVDRVQFLFWSLLPAVIMYGVFGIGKVSQLPSLIVDRSVLYAILYSGVLNGLLVYWCMFYALKRVKGEEYGLFSYIGPASAAVVAVVFFGEKFTPILFAGVAIIATGLYLAEAHRAHSWHHKVHFLSRSK